jgi:hypothetical protein
MTEALIARVRGAPNPFLLNRIDSAWEGTFTDVPSINTAAFRKCQETIETVRQTGQSRGLLLTGVPGSGKSHLLRRLRQAVTDGGGRDCFAYIPPVATKGRLYGELLRRVVGDMVRGQGEGSASQLETIFIRELLGPQARARLTPVQLWNDLRSRTSGGPALFERLGTGINQLTQSLQLHPDVMRVLQFYLAEHHRTEAYRWLMGYSVPEDINLLLGVARSLEDEEQAREALFTLSKLSGRNSVLVLAFDQLEGMQLHSGDLEGVLTFGNTVADILNNCRNIAAISCVQSYFRDDLEKVLPPAHKARIAQDLGRIELLDRSGAESLVLSRLEGEPAISEARTALGEHGLWPIDARQFHAAMPSQAGDYVSARSVLDQARGLFEQWRNGDNAPVSPPPDDSLELLGEIYVARQRLAASEAPDEGTYADGLLKLLNLRRPGSVRRSMVPGFDIELNSQDVRTAVSVCHAMNMTSLAARLRQVTAALDQGSVRRAIVVRDARLAVSRTAIRTKERLDHLKDRGDMFIRPPAAAYAAIAAARALLAEAAAGDLTGAGQMISADEVRQWLMAERPSDAFDLLEEIDGPTIPYAVENSAGLESICEALNGPCLLTLEELAHRLGQPEAEVAAQIQGQRMLGIINGSPSLVYLRPDGLRRSF